MELTVVVKEEIFLWFFCGGKKVINLCVVEGTPFCGAAPEGWVFLKAYVPERLSMERTGEGHVDPRRAVTKFRNR